MSRTFHLIKKEFIQIRRDPSLIRILIIIPIVQLLILGYVVSSEVKNIATVICDLDNSQLSRQLVERIRNSAYFRVKYFEPHQQNLADYLDRGRASVAIVIPDNLTKNIASNIPTAIQILVDGVDSNSSTMALGYISGILESFLSEQLTQYVQLGTEIHLLTANVRVWYNEDLKFSHFMIPGLIVFLLTMVTTLISAIGLVREREIGTLEQLLVAPIKKHEMLIGKIVPFAVIGLLEVSLAIAFAKVWYHIPIAGNLGLFALFIVVYLFTTLGIGLFVSASVQTQQQAMFMSFFFIVFFMFLSGFLFQIENMPRIAQYLSYLDPMRYLVVVVRELFIKGAGMKYLYWQGIALVIFGSMIFSFAALRFQRRMK
ncbi:MAG: ABC transporter permease [candidate division KSB1 bacterium]|nr:ABC transporter permease [candidate division KSB1 bacterium]MDZ7335499.1 ABC transporter permease [candidate division KSB1 bacterium]MDZ7357121.1 ABC transporter permease [candidate division KSB1 bacterium]